MLPMHAAPCKYLNDSYTMLPMHVDTTGYLLEMHTLCYPHIFVPPRIGHMVVWILSIPHDKEPCMLSMRADTCPARLGHC